MCDKKGMYSLSRNNPYGGKLNMGKMLKMCVCVFVYVSILAIQSHIICVIVLFYVKSWMRVKICVCMCDDN